MNYVKLEVIICLNEVVNYLDKVWCDCWIVFIIGNSVGILGGVLIIGGGIVMFFIVGVVIFLLMVGFLFGVVVVGIGLGIVVVKVVVNFK